MVERHLRLLAGFFAVLSIAALAAACGETATPEPQASLVPSPKPVSVFATVTVQPSEAGSVDVVPGPNQGDGYRAGTNLVLTAHANQGFRFTAWAGDQGGTANPVSVTLVSDLSVVAVFEQSADATIPTVTITGTARPLPTVVPTSSSSPKPTPGVNDFAFKASELPEACSVLSVMSSQPEKEDPPWLGKITSNPFVSTDREFVDAFVDAWMSDWLSIPDVSQGIVAALFAIYYEGEVSNEIGIFGGDFDSKSHFDQVADAIATGIDTRDKPWASDHAVYVLNKTVLFIWRDSRGGDCFSQLKTLVEARISTIQSGNSTP